MVPRAAMMSATEPRATIIRDAMFEARYENPEWLIGRCARYRNVDEERRCLPRVGIRYMVRRLTRHHDDVTTTTDSVTP